MKEKFDALILQLHEIVQRQTDFEALSNDLSTRLSALSGAFEDLMDLNQQYVKTNPNVPKVHFDPDTSVLSVEEDGVRRKVAKLNRADPDVPIEYIGGNTVTGFKPKPPTDPVVEHEEIGRKLAYNLEAYYREASKIWDIVEEDLLGKKNSRFIGAKMVRNKLIEHGEEGQIRAFGTDDLSGPKIRPQYKKKPKQKWEDSGLVPNTTELLERILVRLERLNGR